MPFLRGVLQVAIRLAVVLGALAFLLELFFVDIYKVPHNGMAPTLVYGDEVVVWRDATMDMGDVMLCEHPAAPGKTVLGRAIAFAGSTVSTDRFGSIYVDSSRSTTEPLGTQRFYDVTRSRMYTMDYGSLQYAHLHTHEFYRESGMPFVITPYQVNRGAFLLGDNRSDSDDDSREFGEVDPNHCLGQVILRLRPAPSNGDDISHFYFSLIR